MFYTPKNKGSIENLEDFVPSCAKCGYNLTGLTEYRCPECGEPFDPVALLKQQLLPRGPSEGPVIVLLLFVAPTVASFSAVILGFGLREAFGLLVLAMLFLAYLVFNGKNIKARVGTAMRHGTSTKNPLYRLIHAGGIVTVLVLQAIPVALFWTLLLWWLKRNPPKFFGF